MPGVGDELLGAVDRPAVVGERGARAHVAGVRARLGLGQPERAEDLARRQLRHPLLLLLLGAEQVDRLRAQRRVRAQRDRHRGVHARELLDRDRVGQRIAPASAVLLRERDAHQPKIAELLDDRVRERLRAVELLRDRSDLLLGEVAHRAADQLVVVGEIEVHAILIPNARYKMMPPPRRDAKVRSPPAGGRRDRRRAVRAPRLPGDDDGRAERRHRAAERRALPLHRLQAAAAVRDLRAADGPAARAGRRDRGARRSPETQAPRRSCAPGSRTSRPTSTT